MSQQKKGGGPPTKETKDQNKINPNLTVRVVSAYIYKDYEVKGKMDPFVKLKLGNQEYQTSTATDQGQNPKWGEDAQFSFYHTKEEKLIVELWEDDVDTEDDYLGTAEILIKDLQNKQGEQKYITYDNGQKIAEVILNIKYDAQNKIDPQKNQKSLDEAQKKSQQISEQNQQSRRSSQIDQSQNQSIQNNSNINSSRVDNSKQKDGNPNIVVQILSARILNNYEEQGKMDPYFIMKMGEQTFRTTTAQNQGQNPKWTEGAKNGFFRTIENNIILELWEDDVLTEDDYLGTANIDITQLISEQPPQNQYVIYDKSGNKIGDVQLLIQIDMKQMKNNSVIDNKKANKINSSALTQNSTFNIKPIQNLGIQKLDANRTISKEELSQKTKEIQERLNNIQVKLRPQPLVPYIEDNVHKALLEGMKKLAKERPTNPIRELGVFLINYNETSSIQRKKTN